MNKIYFANGTEADLGIRNDAYYEDRAKITLNGKVMICLGDSYTVGMKNQFETIATKYGMIVDNRGVVGATISYRSTDSNRRMYLTADTIVSNYTDGYIIDSTTYNVDDVAVITFMGGANDGSGINAWIGTGIHETDKTTIYGSLNHIFSTFQTTFTKAKIICITQPSFYSISVSSLSTDAQAQEVGFDNLSEVQVLSDVQYSNYLMAQKEKAVRDIAWAYQLPVVDMFNEFPTVGNPANRATYWQSDKLHLTTAGYNIVANAINKKIARIYGE